MLQVMRRGANSWLFVLLFAAIIFVFAINFGPWAGRVGGGLQYAAEVNGRVITISEFQSAYSNAFRSIQNYRPDFSHEQAEAEGMRILVVDQLVSKELMAQLAERHNLSIGDAELAQFIQKHMFGPNQPFNREAYKQAIYSNFHTTEAQFEQQIRREMMADRMNQLIGTGAYVSNNDVKEAFNTRYNRVSLDVIKIDPSQITVSIDDKSIPAWISSHEKEIANYYDSHIKEFRTPKQVRARHILIKTAPDARQKIESIAARLKKGEDFASLAKETSQDGSAQNGGDLGFFAQGAMVKSFEEAAFKLEPGQVSEIVETPFGFHIIKLEEIKMPMHRELATVKDEIASRILKSTEEKQSAQKLANAVLADMTSGKALPINKAVTKSETGFFRRDVKFIPGIGNSPELLKAAFALTKEQPVATKVFELNDNFYVVKLKDRESADPAQFDQDKETLRASLTMTKRRELMQHYVGFLKKDAKIEYNPQLIGTPATQQP